MRKPALCFLLAGFGMQAALHGQAPEPQGTRPAAGFTLTLSEGHRGSIVPSFQVLAVKLTNLSDALMHRTTCDAFGEQYNLEVVYNGVPIPKTAAELEWRKQPETGLCTGSAKRQVTGPGQARYDILYAEASKPGTYAFTVTRETFAGEPEKSVTVGSNTITIVVKPEDLAPK